MRCIAICSLCLVPLAAAGWPWPPWPPWKKTTTPKPLPVDVTPFASFEHGVAAALGFDDVTPCVKDTNASAHDFWDAAQDYEKGGYIKKAEALADFAEGMSKITIALASCAEVMTDISKYKKLVEYLTDPRFYTWHNAFTLALNTAEDRKQLGAFTQSWKSGDFKQAGFDLMSTILDVLEHPGIPSGNGTQAVQLAYGLASGFVQGVDFKCFQDVEVEIPALVGGVLDVMSVVKAVSGLESIFHGLTGLVPTYRQCLADKPKIMNLLHDFKDFRNDTGLAQMFGKHIENNAIDLGLETASCVLDYKGGEWERFGEDIGDRKSVV